MILGVRGRMAKCSGMNDGQDRGEDEDSSGWLYGIG